MAKVTKRFTEYMIPNKKGKYVYVYPENTYTEYIKQSRRWTDKELKEAVHAIAKRAQSQITAAKKAGYTRFLPYWARYFKSGTSKLNRKQTQRLLNKAIVILQGGYTITALKGRAALADQKRAQTIHARYPIGAGVDVTDKHFWEFYNFLRSEFPAYDSDEALTICLMGYDIYKMGNDYSDLKYIVELYESGRLKPQTTSDAEMEAMTNESDFEINPFNLPW